MLEYQDQYIITILIKKDIDEKNKDIIEKIKEIYYLNKGRYGYRRVTLELKNQGLNINHKKVQRLMKKLNLQSIIRKKKKIFFIQRSNRKDS